MPTRGRQPDWSADGPHQFDEFLLKYLSDIDAPTKTKLMVYTCNCVWLDLSLSAMEDMDKVALKEEILKKSYAHWLSPKYMGAVDWLEPGQKRKTGKPPAGFWAFDGKQDRWLDRMKQPIQRREEQRLANKRRRLGATLPTINASGLTNRERPQVAEFKLHHKFEFGDLGKLSEKEYQLARTRMKELLGDIYDWNEKRIQEEQNAA